MYAYMNVKNKEDATDQVAGSPYIKVLKSS